MDWAQVLTVFLVVIANLGTIITLYLHLDNKTNATLEAMRKDSELIRRDSEERQERWRQETYAQLEAIRTETKAVVEAIRADLRDFHGRLCAIEERNRSRS